MKLQVKFKDPDLISEYIDSVVPYKDSAACDAKRKKVADKYFEFGDYGALEVDTETGLGRLVPIKEWSRW